MLFIGDLQLFENMSWVRALHYKQLDLRMKTNFGHFGPYHFGPYHFDPYDFGPDWTLRPFLEKTLRPLAKTLRRLMKRRFGP